MTDSRFRWMRVVRRQVIQEEEGGGDYYKLVLELVPSGSGDDGWTSGPPFEGAAFAGAQLSDGNLSPLFWAYTGDSPPAGWNANPTVGPLSVVPNGSSQYKQLTTSRDITVRVSAVASIAGVWSVGGSATITCTSSVNGLIATNTDTSPGGFDGLNPTIEMPTYDMVEGEVLTFAGSYLGHSAGGGWGNSGANGTYIRIGRGTHHWGSGGAAETWVGP